MSEKKEDNQENIEIQMSKIVKENRQLSVRIPVRFADKLRIDLKKDRFMWGIIDDEKGLSLKGSLIKDSKEDEN